MRNQWVEILTGRLASITHKWMLQISPRNSAIILLNRSGYRREATNLNGFLFGLPSGARECDNKGISMSGKAA